VEFVENISMIMTLGGKILFHLWSSNVQFKSFSVLECLSLSQPSQKKNPSRNSYSVSSAQHSGAPFENNENEKN
jgi:hypothetical protein